MDNITTIGISTLSGVIGALILFFSFDRKFRGYIKEASGKRPEVSTHVSPQPLMVAPQPSFADKEQTEARFRHVEAKIEGARLENKQEMQKLRDEATEGRRGLHQDIKQLGDRLTDKIGEFSLDVTNKVGELRGEVKRINGRTEH